jgi:hypothetical protein
MSEFARLLNWIMAFCWVALGFIYIKAFGSVEVSTSIYTSNTKTVVDWFGVFTGFMFGAGGLLSCLLVEMLIRVYEKLVPPAKTDEPVQDAEPAATDGNAP